MWNFLSMTLVTLHQLGFSFFPSKLMTMSTCPHAQSLWQRIATLLRHPFNYPEILGLTWSKGHPFCFQTWGKKKENGNDGWVRLCSVDGFVCGVGVPFLVWVLDHCPQVCSPHGSQSLLDTKGGLCGSCPKGCSSFVRTLCGHQPSLCHNPFTAPPMASSTVSVLSSLWILGLRRLLRACLLQKCYLWSGNVEST